MPRARNIKPGFFKNEELIECSMAARLLFIGLWTLADREGRLEDRPKRIKMEIFPCDNVNITEEIAELESHGFLRRYCVEGHEYIQILNFKKHQNPHVKEQASTIPAPCKPDATTEHAGLNPDSGFLNPDSLSPDTSALPETDPVQNVVDSWNTLAEECGLSQVKKVDEKRRAGVMSRLADKDFDLGGVFVKIKRSDFLRGSHGKWKVDFDFVFCSAHNYVKILEGKYDNGKGYRAGNGQGNRVRPIITDAELRKSILPAGPS